MYIKFSDLSPLMQRRCLNEVFISTQDPKECMPKLINTHKKPRVTDHNVIITDIVHY